MKLARWICESGLRPAEVARRLRISQGHLNDLCNDRFWPSRQMMLRIKALTEGAVMPNDFLPDEEEGPPRSPTTRE